MLSDSDEEIEKVELEKAVREYKKNKNEHSKAKDEATRKSKAKTSSKISEKQSTDDNANCWADLQELKSYFLTEKMNQNKKPVAKSYAEYEKQGAIPKHIKKNDSGQIQPKSSKKKLVKTHEKKLEIHCGKISSLKNQVKKRSFCEGSKVSEIEPSMYTFTVNPALDDVIVKVNEDVCSTPFFYMVPNNPSPNFFFSPGSYFIIPKKMPDSLNKDIIIFHPERTVSVGCQQNDDLSKLEKKLNRVTGKRNNSFYESLVPSMNDLGKEVPEKEDSHLNIGPLEAKLNESYDNLDIICAPNKIYEKALLNPLNCNAFDVIPKEKSKKKIMNRDKKSDFIMNEDDLRKNADGIRMSKTDTKNSDGGNAKSDTTIKGNRQVNKNLTKKSYSEAVVIEKQEERLFENMILALPEIQIDELKEKFLQFQGDETSVKNYIQKKKKILKTRERVLHMQLILPEADPDFLYQEIVKLEGDKDSNIDDTINVLVEKLLDNNEYPKVSENNSNSERRSLWRKYVQNFSVKHFILNVPDPQNFAGPNGDHNKASMELILNFLISRYPSVSRDFLEDSFESNDNNLTKTCIALAHLQTVRLSESSFEHEAFNEAFLKEACYIDHKEEVDMYLEEIKERKALEMEEALLNDVFLFCPLCGEDKLIACDAVVCAEGHIFCKECIKRYILIKLGDGIYKFPCPSDKCDAFFLHSTLEEILPENVLSTIIKKQQAEEISNAELDGCEFCPHCEFAYIPNPEDKVFRCQNPECLIETCRKCHEKNHIPLRCEEVERSIDLEARKKIEESMTEKLLRTCPTCFKKFVKTDGCNKMICTCGTIVCYFCRKKITGYNHFKEQSPSGICPLYSNNETLHKTDIVAAGIETRNRILQENPNVRIKYDFMEFE